MNLNQTTSFSSTPNRKPEVPSYFALLPLVVLAMSSCIVAVVFYLKRRSRLDELRHQLIPVYTYDPGENQEDWRDYDKDEEAELLYKDSQLSFDGK
ncbi:uncharacterized protein C3orf18 homolog [Poeciliopsis prolifica]|uniref:uncharacterized protein C3orf18 homolog n=1 Tax=Poeciliopsis prolifica TaxID=188132 RepID=UPI002412F30C|nr:uncharacterized protein C3orf18 homolog [Poeciliopsis prolifica]XP_054887057.1 uncharacterized protein C3orf18 homolog [Poeciliopsis prolifica]